MKLLSLLLVNILIINCAFGQFNNGTTEQIDQINNNTQVDIILNPTNAVKINNFTGSKALQSGAANELEESLVTSTELGFVSGVTSSIQAQINGKQDALPLSTDGDLLYYNAGFASLPIGTAGQVLTVNGSLLPEWQDIIAVSVTTKGDIQTYSTQPDRLPVGSNGQLLSANSSTSTGLEWIDAPSTSPTTTVGDIIYNNTGSAAGDTRLAIGTEDQLLTVKSGVPSWEDAPVSTTLTTKGQIQGFSTQNEAIPGDTCLDGEHLVKDDNEATGWKCSAALTGTLNPITDWDSFTPSDTTYAWGTASATEFFNKRSGDEVTVTARISLSSAVTGTLFFSPAEFLPSGLSLDTSKLTATNNPKGVVSVLDDSAGSGADTQGGTAIITATGVFFLGGDLSQDVFDNASPFTWASGDRIEFTVTVPIVGFTSGIDAAVQNIELTAETANELSAKIAGGGGVTSENYSFIDSVTHTATSGIYTINLTSGVFSQAPSATCTVGTSFSNSYICNTNVVSSTTIEVEITTDANVNADAQFDIVVSKQGADVNKSQVILGTFDSMKWECQTKILGGDVTANGSLPALSFNNLTIGKKYSLTINAYVQPTNGDTLVLLSASNNSVFITRAGIGNRGTALTQNFVGSTGLFEAAATTVDVASSSIAAGSSIRGNGTREQTFTTLCQLPDNYIIDSTQWN